MSRFQVSKFRNMSSKPLEGQVSVKVEANLPSTSDLVASSGYLYAFLAQNGRIQIGSHLDSSSLTVSQVSTPTDFHFSPFNDDVLAVANQAGSVFLFRVPIEPDGEERVKQVADSLTTLHTFSLESSFASVVKFHPTSSPLLYLATESNTVLLYDCQRGDRPLLCTGSDASPLKSISADPSGRTLACAHHSRLSLYDCATEWQSPVASTPLQDILPTSDMRVQQTGHSLLISYISNRKYRCLSLFDPRMLTTPTHHSVDISSVSNPLSIFLPLYDSDTDLLYLPLRNSNQVQHVELSPNLTCLDVSSSGSSTSVSVASTVKGACLASKRALRVMQAEVNRVMLLTSSCLLPLAYHVPRKSYYDFHSDLYPPTHSPHSSLPLEAVCADQPLPTVSLDPKETPFSRRFRFGVDLIPVDDEPASVEPTQESPPEQKPSSSCDSTPNLPQPEPSQSEAKAKRVTLSAPVKCKYLEGSVGKRDTHITNIHNVATNVPPSCETFKANHRVGFYLQGSHANQVAVVSLSREAGSGYRMSGGRVPHIQCPSPVSHFCLDPFDPLRLAVAVHSGSILIFSVESLLVTDQSESDHCPVLEESVLKLSDLSGRVSLLSFHPLAENILASASSSEPSVLLWNLTKGNVVRRVSLPSPALHFHFGQYVSRGSHLVVACKEQQLALLDVLRGDILQSGTLPYRVNSCRLTWILQDRFILLTGFNGLSERQFYLYEPGDLCKGPLCEYSLNVAPSVLVPHFDEDTHTLFLVGRGDSLLYCFELNESPFATPLASFDTPTPNQSVAFLPKRYCDVRTLEFARGYRLTHNSIEPFSLRVPRLHMDYFHDDLFPPTRDVESPMFGAQEWLDSNPDLPLPTPPTIDLKPADLENLSSVKGQLGAAKTKPKQEERRNLGPFPAGLMDENSLVQQMMLLGREKQQTLVEQMSGLVGVHSHTQQEEVEGVDSDEWDD